VRTRWLAVCWLVALRFSLRRRVDDDTVPALLRSLDVEAPWETAPLPDALFTVRRAEALVRRAPTVPDTCLYRAVGRYSTLRRLGAPVRFVMGVRREGDGLAGHAWVEVGGEVVLEPEAPRYEVTFAYP
jgi:hypothetical protein